MATKARSRDVVVDESHVMCRECMHSSKMHTIGSRHACDLDGCMCCGFVAPAPLPPRPEELTPEERDAVEALAEDIFLRMAAEGGDMPAEDAKHAWKAAEVFVRTKKAWRAEEGR